MKKRINELPEIYSKDFLTKNIEDMVQAVEFDGINYYTPNGSISLPSFIDSAYATTIATTDNYISTYLNDEDSSDIFLPIYNHEMALNLVTNNVAITVTSLYKRFIYEINTIIPSNSPICESTRVLNNITGVIAAFVLNVVDRIKFANTNAANYNSDDLHSILLTSVLECMNGIGVMIYNNTLTEFTNKLYSNNNFGPEFVQNAFIEYTHSHNMFMIDLTSEVAPMTVRMVQGANFILGLSYTSDN